MSEKTRVRFVDKRGNPACPVPYKRDIFVSTAEVRYLPYDDVLEFIYALQDEDVQPED